MPKEYSTFKQLTNTNDRLLQVALNADGGLTIIEKQRDTENGTDCFDENAVKLSPDERKKLLLLLWDNQ